MPTPFADLCEVVPPPINAVDAGNPMSFAAVEASLGLILPADYKNLVGAYGTGSWKGFLWVLNPFALNRFLNLLVQTESQLDAERVTRAGCPDQIPFPIHPEPGGLLPWAMTDNGDRLYWLTKGHADHWPTIIYESRGPRYDSFDMSCCEFLRKWVAGHLTVSVFPDDFEYGFANAFEPLSVPV